VSVHLSKSWRYLQLHLLVELVRFEDDNGIFCRKESPAESVPPIDYRVDDEKKILSPKAR
jgi:hypothetical protein